jgi:hypothetical protein
MFTYYQFPLKPLNNYEGYKPNGRTIVISLMAIASMLLAGCAAKKTPFPIEKYCTGSVARTDPSGKIYMGPESCGGFAFTTDKINFLPADSALTGEAKFNLHDDGTNVSGDFIAVSVKEDLPDCVKDVLVKKEVQDNAAAAEFMHQNGIWNLFRGNQGQIVQGGYTFHDALAANLSIADMGETETACMQKYAPTMYTDDLLAEIAEQPPLDSLGHGSQTTFGDVCELIDMTVSVESFVGGDFLPSSQLGYADILQLADAAQCDLGGN